MIHIVFGPTGAGKTTYALKLARQRNAVFFAVDEWMRTLFFPDIVDEIEFTWAMERVTRCENMIWAMSRQILAQEREVVLEVSMTTLQHRNVQRSRAEECGVPYQLHYIDADREVRRARVANRNKEKGETWCFDVDDGMFDFVENMHEPPDDEELAEAEIISS